MKNYEIRDIPNGIVVEEHSGSGVIFNFDQAPIEIDDVFSGCPFLSDDDAQRIVDACDEYQVDENECIISECENFEGELMVDQGRHDW